ncbi:hypothetical protein SAMN02745132_01961 [Enterovibrio nigricans DSM 22720]|uniref:Uncharacterized protein n=1 Tax=Enterovibrio nigricans DSM 22720 TaxID=1121868 RepID=A0A1T4UL48_9GAMM|nr:hypothetical protein SAMN02745132_01961 [Enterovibrio nigricans DSM 22720]
MDSRLLFLLPLFVYSSTAFSHEGHDHSHWLSGFIHLLWIAPFAIGAIIIVLIINYMDIKNTSGGQ